MLGMLFMVCLVYEEKVRKKK